MKNRQAMMLLTAILLLAAQAQAELIRYEIEQGSEVVFESKAPMDSFKGRTQELGGWFVTDLSDPGGPVELEIQVALASFDTGIGKRNQHMRDNHLETDTYPLAWFRGGTVTEVTGEDGKIHFTLEGEMDLHGVIRPLTCSVELQQHSDGTATVVTDFVIKLSDHDIKRPKFLIMKLADEQKVRVELVVRPAATGAVHE